MNRLIVALIYIIVINVIIAAFRAITGESFEHCAVVVLIGVVASLAAKPTVKAYEES